VALRSLAVRAGRTILAPGPPGHLVRPASWADRRNRTSGCCTPRSSAAASSSPGRTASRRPGASCSRCSTTRPTSAPTRGDHGDPTTRKPGSAVTPLAAAMAARGPL